MYQGLIKVLRKDKNGVVKSKWVRPEGIKPPSGANSYRRKYVNSIRLKIIDLLGRKCGKCGYDSDVRALQIDHINGDGGLDRKGPNKTKTGGSYYHLILKNIESDRYQVLCANCNMIKRSENQECPRKGIE